MGYIEVPIDIEPVDMAEDAFGYIEAQVPGWLPSPGNLEAWVIEANAQMAGELREVEALVPDAIFAFFGESVLGLPPFAAVAATGLMTFTAVDNAGYSVDAGTLVALTPPAATDSYAFQVVDDFTIPAGATNIVDIAVQAIEPGADASGITGTVAVIDALDFITSVVLQEATSGGVDAETSDEYLDRLSNLLTLLAPRPILPQDFAVMTEQSIAGVGRAVAIDLYNAQTQTGGVPRCVTVVVVDDDGNACSTAVKQETDAYLQARREVNFLVFVADPTYTTINVTFDVVVYPGNDATDVVARTVSALTSYLSPGGWGLPPYGDTGSRSWVNETSVRYLEVAEVINRVDGVHYINTLTIGKLAGPMGTVDLALTGIAPLPKPGTMTGTGTAET